MADPRGLSAARLSAGHGRRIVVDGLDLAIADGAITCLLGANGSGKSTLLRTLARLLAPLGGEVRLDGRPAAGLPARAFARRVGMLPQNPRAPEGVTVADLVRQGRYPHRDLFGRLSARDARACEDALALTDLAGHAATPLDSLSGGQRQRAWIAMVLAQETDILLLDEPTSFLDLAHQIEVMDLLARLVGDHGKTVVTVLHKINLAARYADTVLLLKDGRLVASGPPRDTITAPLLGEVFGIDSTILADPYTGAPLCVPAGGRTRRIPPATGDR